MILIFGIHPSGVDSAPIALAERFLSLERVDEEEGEDDDMAKSVMRQNFAQKRQEDIVDDHDVVLRMMRDPADLGRCKA